VSFGSIHDLRADAFHYAWDNSIEQVLEIESGEVIELHARDASDDQIRRSSTAADVAKIDFAHVNPVSGPVFVKGARPGDTLAVELLELRASDWGWTAIIPGFGLLADEFPDPWLRISPVESEGAIVRFSERVSLPLRPFPGTLGVAPADSGVHPILPPTRFGGNLDTKHLTAGSTLYLPIGVDGALFSLGDTHAAQGDGEVCGTAIESAMDVVLRLSLRRDLAIDAPQYDVPANARFEPGGQHVCTGVGPDLLEAARDAIRAMIRHLGDRHGIERQEAYALASVACDLRIHELVDVPNWVVGAFLPNAIFDGEQP
jgi:acetamidase/formamidase